MISVTISNVEFLMSDNGQGTQDAEVRVIALTGVSGKRPSRFLGYGHISRSAKRVSRCRAKRNHEIPSCGRDLLPTSSCVASRPPVRKLSQWIPAHVWNVQLVEHEADEEVVSDLA